MSKRRLLLVGEGTSLLEMLTRLQQAGLGLEVEAVSGEAAAVTHASATLPDVVICEWRREGFDGLDVFRRLRARPETGDIPVILLASPGVPVADAWTAGAEAVFRSPPDLEELSARIRALALVRGRRDAQGRARHALEESVSRLVDLIVELADTAQPGLEAHGDAVARLSERLAERFEVPGGLRTDLVLAARLHRIAQPILERQARAEADSVRCGAATAAELREIPSLAGAAELVSQSGEHWDGSGRPDGLQRGQIPLRARIIRVATDLVDQAMRTPGAGLSGALGVLLPHAGTWYDPAVLAEAASVLHDSAGEDDAVERLVLERLEPGMRLEEDLVTASGVKLLAQGGILTAASLAAVVRRHLTDPIVHAVRVRRLGR